MTPTNKTALLHLLAEMVTDSFVLNGKLFADQVTQYLSRGLSLKEPDTLLRWLRELRESIEVNEYDDDWLTDVERSHRQWSPN